MTKPAATPGHLEQAANVNEAPTPVSGPVYTPKDGDTCAVCGASYTVQTPARTGDCPAGRCPECWDRGKDISAFHPSTPTKENDHA